MKQQIGNQKYNQHFDIQKNPLDNESYIVDISNARKSKIFPIN